MIFGVARTRGSERVHLCVAMQRSRYAKHFGIEPPAGEWPVEIYRDYVAPIIRRGVNGGRESLLGTFGMVPRKRIPEHVRDYDTINARSETIGKLRSFAKPWAAGQLCLVPAQAVFEPRYPDLPNLVGPNRDEAIKTFLEQKSELWSISVANGDLFAVAGIWRA